ncbi:MAG: class I SAM-dependent methyltransferase, partial [Acidobacteriaceae bacterium]|nr:class I SAM-dependent methyltransferase [Acidobacteriaceae bacterium]
MANFRMECLDINEAMLARGRQLAHDQGVESNIVFTRGDFNKWHPSKAHDAVIANQSLHHVLELEALLSSIKAGLSGDG